MAAHVTFTFFLPQEANTQKQPKKTLLRVQKTVFGAKGGRGGVWGGERSFEIISCYVSVGAAEPLSWAFHKLTSTRSRSLRVRGALMETATISLNGGKSSKEPKGIDTL